MSGFQTQANLQQAPAVAGDFASSNPRSTVVPGEGGFVAGTAGVTVGAFAWVQADGQTILNTPPSGYTGAPDGFVHRDQQALITTYLAQNGNVIPAGFPVVLHKTGDFWVTVNVAGATRGQKAFASQTTGAMQPANAGATVSGYVETQFYIDQTASVNTLTVMGC